MATSHMTAQLGRVLGGRYRLVAPLGSGSSAQVYLADDITLQRRVAVKILHPALAEDEAFLRRFGAEARAAAALSHPNVMAVYDWGDDGGPYLVLEHLGGGSLRAMLDTGVQLSVSQILSIGLQAAHALDVAHRRGFVHRDVKPANLVFGDDGRLRIADFGLTRALAEAAWTEPGVGLVGTARYAAPEQASSSRIDGKADIYALGLVLVEAATGVVPLTADTNLGTLMVRVDNQVPVPDSLGPLRDIVERCGRPDPADRPEAAELVRAFTAAARTLEPPAPLPLAGAVDPAAQASMADADPTLHVASAAAALERTAPVPVVTSAMGADDLDSAGGGVVSSFSRRRPPSGRPGLRALIAVAVVIGIVGAAALVYLASRPPSAIVPNLANLTEDEARAALDEARTSSDEPVEWVVTFSGEHSERVLEGVVIRQEPAPDTKLADNGAATVIVSKGPPFVPVPDLAALDRDAASAALERANLVLGEVVERPDETAPPGDVVEWSVDGAVRPPEARKGSTVDLVTSSGPAPREIPDVTGNDVPDARKQLEALDLDVQLREEYSDEVAEGEVIGTDPAAGNSVAKRTEVTLRVSRGPEPVSIPDIIRDRLDDAINGLRSVGLAPGDVSGRANGVVRATRPPPGSRVDPGTEVDLILR